MRDGTDGKAAFNHACDETLAYLQLEIAGLRFTQAA